jgi:hypothetical protein
MDMLVIIDNLLAVIWTLVFWQALRTIPLVFKVLGLEKVLPQKIHAIFKALFFCYFYIGMKESLSEENIIINKFISSFYYLYEHSIFVVRILAMVIPVLFTLKMLGVDLEKIKSWISSGDNSGRVGSSKPRKEGTGEFSKWTHLRPSYMHRIRILRSRR